jgi:signal transduction histidine kinase
MLPRIFERFWQGRRARLEKTRGLGIGLFITRHLVELQGGTIEARSDGPGQGAHFTVRLPLDPGS